MGINHLGEDKISYLEDYQFLESLLTEAEGEKAASKAKKLIKKYGDLVNILDAEQSCIKEYAKLNNHSIRLLKFIKESIRRTRRKELSKIPILNNPRKVFEYCRLVFEGNMKEVFGVFYVDYQHRLIQEEFTSNGNPRLVRVDIKDIVRKALIYRAKGLIIVHNHPSGVLLASEADIQLTQRLNQALETLDMQLLDHLIINDFEYYSFKAQKLIEFEIQYLSMEEKILYIKSLVSLGQKRLNHSKEGDLIKNTTEGKLTSKQIKEYKKAFRSIGVEASEQWIANGLTSLIINNTDYKYLEELNLDHFNNEHLKRLNAESPIFFSYISDKGELLFISETYERILQQPCKEIVGKNLKELIGEQGYIICKPFLEQAMAGQEVKFNYLWQYQENQFKHLELHYIPSYDYNQKVVGIFAFVYEKKVNNVQIGQYLSELGEILPVNAEKKPIKFNTVLCQKVLSQTLQVLQDHKVRFDHKILFDIASNVYETSKSDVDLKYIKELINTGIKAGRLSCQ